VKIRFTNTAKISLHTAIKLHPSRQSNSSSEIFWNGSRKPFVGSRSTQIQGDEFQNIRNYRTENCW